MIPDADERFSDELAGFRGFMVGGKPFRIAAAVSEMSSLSAESKASSTILSAAISARRSVLRTRAASAAARGAIYFIAPLIVSVVCFVQYSWTNSAASANLPRALACQQRDGVISVKGTERWVGKTL